MDKEMRKDRYNAMWASVGCTLGCVVYLFILVTVFVWATKFGIMLWNL